MEKLFFDICCNEDQNKISIKDKDDLKIKLKSLAIKKYSHNASKMCTDEKNALASLRSNKDIIIQRPDKGGGAVIMNASSYADKLNNLINDNTKFNKCPSNQSDKVKRKINKIAAEFKDTNETLHRTLKRKGAYCNGHLYGLPKIHKCREDPPVRPIVTMSGTVTHDVAQLNILTTSSGHTLRPTS